MWQPPSPPPALDPRVETGLRWAAARQIVTGVAGTAGVVAYTRFLQPADLGAAGLAFLVYNGLFLIVRAPIQDAVVYYRDEDGAHGSAAFWLLLAFSTIAVALVMAGAGLFAQWYQSPVAEGLTRAAALAFYLQALAVVPGALLLQRFRFAAYEGWMMILQLVQLAGWVALAASGFGPWSLILPSVAGAVLWVAVSWILTRFRPARHPGRDALRDVVHFSRSLFGSKVLLYLKNNLDNAAVGTLGESALGWYVLGEDQSQFATVGIGGPIAQIALPAMAAVRAEGDRLRRMYLDMLRMTATLSTPAQIGALLLADLGIALIFGPQWLPATDVLRAYIAFRLIDTLLQIADSATSAVGRPDLRLAYELWQLPFFVAGVAFGLYVLGGIAGVAVALAIVRSVAGLVYFAVTLRTARVDLHAARQALLPSTLAGLTMGAVVFALRALLPPLGDVLLLAVLTLAGLLVYAGLLFALDPAGFREIVRMAWEILAPEPLRRWLPGSRG